jgi:hypothetical protein
MDLVVAQAILRAPDGTSLLDAESPPGASDTELPVATAETVEEAARRLTALGFTVADRGAATLSFTGSRELFETTFETSLRPTAGTATDMTYWQPISPVRLPSRLADLIASVAFPIEPTFTS